MNRFAVIIGAPGNRAAAPPPHFLQHRYYWAVWEPGHSGPSAFW